MVDAEPEKKGFWGRRKERVEARKEVRKDQQDQRKELKLEKEVMQKSFRLPKDAAAAIPEPLRQAAVAAKLAAAEAEAAVAKVRCV